MNTSRPKLENKKLDTAKLDLTKPIKKLSPKRSFRRGRLSGQVVDELEKMIAGEYPEPGQNLPNETDLAERFQVSRVVVREAMKILEDRGVVEVKAGRGTRTLAPSPERVKSSLLRLFSDRPLPTMVELDLLLEMRQVLEETAAGLAAVRATSEDLREMESALKGMRGDDPECGIEESDLRFHRVLARATHNPFFEIVLEPLTQVYLQQIQLTDTFSVGAELHDHVFNAIRAGNQVAARQAVRRLMKFTRDDSQRALALLQNGTETA